MLNTPRTKQASAASAASTFCPEPTPTSAAVKHTRKYVTAHGKGSQATVT